MNGYENRIIKEEEVGDISVVGRSSSSCFTVSSTAEISTISWPSHFTIRSTLQGYLIHSQTRTGCCLELLVGNICDLIDE